MSIYYRTVTKRIVIANGGNEQIDFINVNTGFENFCIWAWLIDGSDTGTATATLNDIALSSPAPLALSTTPQLMQIAGVFPPNAPQAGSGNSAYADNPPSNGVIPGVTIANTGADPAVYLVTLIARVYGPSA